MFIVCFVEVSVFMYVAWFWRVDFEEDGEL